LTTNEEKAEYQKRYEEWLVANGTPLKVQTSQSLFCDGVYTHPNGMTVSIRQLSDRSDRIIIVANLNLPPAIQAAFSSLPDVEKAALSVEITLGLIQLGVQFSFPMQNNTLQGVTVERTVFGESMTKQIFFDNLYRIIDALVIVQLRFQQKLGSGTNQSSIGGSEVNTSFYG
jgi:hypothetical protein